MLNNISRVSYFQKKYEDHLLHADVISFFAASKCQKIPKIGKMANIEEQNLHIFERFDEFQWNFQEKCNFRWYQTSQKIRPTRSSGVARDFLEVGSKSSEMPATMVGRRRKFWVAELLKGQFSDPFQWDFTYSNLSFLVAELFSLP